MNPPDNAESVAAVVAAWERTLDACGMDLWQVNRPSHKGKWGSGPVNLASLAADAVRALAELNDGSDAQG